MKKAILVSLAASVVVSSSLMAGDWYVGASVARSSVKIETTGATATSDSSGTKMGYGIKGGYGFNSSNGVELEYVRIAKNISGARVNYVYKYPINKVGLFIGGGIGLIDYKEDFSANNSVYTLGKRATALNVKGGITYKIAKKHEIGLGYDYVGIANMSENYTNTVQSVDIGLKNVRVGRAYLEYSYLF